MKGLGERCSVKCSKCRDVASGTKKQCKKWAETLHISLGQYSHCSDYNLYSYDSTSCSFWPAKNYCFKRRKTLKEQFHSI